MRVRVLYTDIDGTLVGPLGNLLWDGNRTPSAVAAEALVRAAQEGLEIVALTGRAQPGMFELARVIGLESWICELGGVRVYERGARFVHERGDFPGPGSPRDGLLRAVERLVAAHPGRLEEHSPWNANRESSFLLRGEVPVSEADATLAAAGLGWVAMVDNGVIPRHYATLDGIDRVRVYHLLPRGVSKEGAVAADRAQRGLDREECAVVGDAGADLDCRNVVGRCFLVRNGFDKDPQLAWALEPGSGVEVTKAGYGDGFAEVVHALLDSGG